ncbi:hypothetical protein AA313_de0207939 [Arthrobotrys entomopaga]|nr:hypothetical protein AA313_de0207939 [Arthrobotrys entomopaga]
MGLIPQGEGHEALNINILGRRQGKTPQIGPSHYYINKPVRPQLHIPEDISSPTSHPIVPSHQRRTSSNSSPSLNEPSSMVWDQSSVPSSTTSEPIYPNSSASGMSHQVYLQSPPYFPGGVEDISYPNPHIVRSNSMPTSGYPMQYPVHAGHGYESPELSDHAMMTPDGYYIDQDQYWNQANIGDDISKLQVSAQHMLGRRMSNSSLHHSESASDLHFLNRGGMPIPYYSDIDEGFGPESPEQGEDELPPYAELIYEALKSAPGHQMHLQDIYQWFRDNYAKFRNDPSKGWMNSIRHNLSMNGAFVKVERPHNEPGKGYMWLLAPAALEGGIKSTTRYRKSGSARTRGTHLMSPDNSYKCYVTPKRNRTGKKYQTKARRTAKKNLQRMQHVDQQQQTQQAPAHEYPEYSTVHTPSMTPDFSPYHSEGFSETLSTSSRNATPAMRGGEWQSPISAPRNVSPFYTGSDDGFNSSYDNGLNGHGYHGYAYDCKPYDDHE